MGVVPPLERGSGPLLLRRLNYGRPRHRWGDICRPTRVERAFRHGLALEQAGVATPRVVAVGVRRWIRWPVRAYLIIEYVPDTVTLDHFLGHGWASKLAYPVADLLPRLHAHGFSHRDLKATNVLVDRHHRPWLIDLDGVRDYGRLPDPRAVLDLARLAQELVVRNIP